MQLLVEHRVNVNVRDKEGMSPSMWACRMDHIEHFEILSRVEQHIDEEDGLERDISGKTWMHWSVRRTEPLECLKVRGNQIIKVISLCNAIHIMDFFSVFAYEERRWKLSDG